MVKRKIISIDQEKCNGCGLCINACHEGALQLINGKAILVKESYCDGLGDCLPACPEAAIIIQERVAEAYDEEAVNKNISKKNVSESNCVGKTGLDSKMINSKNKRNSCTTEPVECSCPGNYSKTMLNHWPVQIKLVPVNDPYFNNAHLLVAADCTAYCYANIHNDFMHNKITLIGCPKLDDTNYANKLTEIIKANNLKSVTVLRMEVPCCGGLVYAVKQALINSGKMIPWSVVTISVDGNIIDE